MHGLILLPGIAFLGVAGILSALVIALGNPNPILRIAAAVTPATLVLYLTLIPALEAVGAALAATLSYSITLVFTVRAFRRAWPHGRRRDLLPGAEDVRDYLLLAARAGSRLRSRRTAS